MMSVPKISILVTMATICFAGCAKKQSVSKTKYIEAGAQGLAATAKLAEVTICTNNTSRSSDIKNAAGMWYAALGASPTINIKNGGTYGECHAWVNFEMLGAGASNTQIMDNPIISMNTESQWFNSNAVLLHEFGHAFGLSDTYNPASRLAGDCIAGQPREAVMCDPGLGKPQQDDINGVQAVAGGSNYPSKIDFSKFEPGTGDFNQDPNDSDPAGDLNSGSDPLVPSQSKDLQSLLAALKGYFGSGASSEVQPQLGLASAQQNPCNSELMRVVYQQATTGGKPRIGVGTKFKAERLTLCLGPDSQCAHPHAERLIPRREVTSEGNWYVAQLNSTKSNVVTVLGFASGSNRQFRCELPLQIVK